MSLPTTPAPTGQLAHGVLSIERRPIQPVCRLCRWACSSAERLVFFHAGPDDSSTGPHREGMMAVANRLFPVVPDTGTKKAARLARELSGSPGCWVRLDCGHSRHVQQPIQAGALLDCPTCPPSVVGGLTRCRVLPPARERRLSARLAPDRLAATRARQLAAEAVADAGRDSLVEEVQQLVSELVASAVRRTRVPVEVTIDTHDGVIRVEVHDEAAVGPDATASRDRRGAGSLQVSATVWAELHGDHAG